MVPTFMESYLVGRYLSKCIRGGLKNSPIRFLKNALFPPHPFSRYESHLINEHGAIFDIEFLIELSMFKQKHGILPPLSQTADQVSKQSKVRKVHTCVFCKEVRKFQY
jgi:hypothetical protein